MTTIRRYELTDEELSKIASLLPPEHIGKKVKKAVLLKIIVLPLIQLYG